MRENEVELVITGCLKCHSSEMVVQQMKSQNNLTLEVKLHWVFVKGLM